MGGRYFETDLLTILTKILKYCPSIWGVRNIGHPYVILRAGTFCPSLGMCQLAGALSEKSSSRKSFCVLLLLQSRLYGYHSRGIYVAKNVIVVVSTIFDNFLFLLFFTWPFTWRVLERRNEPPLVAPADWILAS